MIDYGLINNENLFLIVLGLVWIIGAVIQDMKRREVDNLWNFSLIGFALAYRFIVSIYIGDYWFFLNGLIGFGIFLGLGNLFYYSRLFAGGDAKLLMALGPVLTLSYNWIVNFKIFGAFVILFLIAGSIYSIFYSIVLIFMNFKRFKEEYFKQWKLYKKIFLIGLFFALIWVVLGLIISLHFILIGLFILLFPILFIFAKAIEEGCLVRKVDSSKVTLGDWLYNDVVINGKKIKANWEGVSEKQLEMIKKSKKKIMVRYGIPFTPSFLFGFIGLLYLGIRYSL